MRSFHSWLGAVALLALVAACERAPRDDLTGEWQRMDEEGTHTLTFRPDSTFHVDFGTWESDGTYSRVEPQTVQLQPRPGGRLAASMPAGMTAELHGDSLSLCSPGGCATYYRPEVLQ
jgi:hypothetical protein